MQKITFLIFLLFSWQTASAVNVTFVNNTPAIAKIDYINCTYASGTAPIKFGTSDNGPLYGIPGNSTITYTCSDSSSLQFAQYSVASYVSGTPACYVTVSGNSLIQGNSFQDCTINGDTITLQWPTPQINSANLLQDPLTVFQQFLTQKPSSTNNPATGLLPNVIPLTSTQLAYEEMTQNNWSLQYAYDATRFPLWGGACLLAASQSQTGDQTCSSSSTTGRLINTLLTNLLASIKTQASTGNISSNGYWAYTFSDYVDGQPVAGGDTTSIPPALAGPLAVAELAINGSTTFYNNLITALTNYDIANNTPQTQRDGDFMASTAPYFNAALSLLSEALLVGNGSFNLTNSDSSTGYVSYNQFMANYNSWISSSAGFVVPTAVLDSQGNTHQALRVIFSVKSVPTSSLDFWAHAGSVPTVSEGMAYGLLISYAANDQATFDKLLNYIVYEARQVGCAGMNKKQTSCTIKTNYLMPWLVDAFGLPVHDKEAGGFYTNGSAADADMNIVWALTLANQRWGSTSSSYLMPDINYQQLAQNMVSEMAFFDIIYQGVSLMGQGNYILYSPGSQWGEAGTQQIYPGYYSPAALEAIGNILNPTQ